MYHKWSRGCTLVLLFALAHNCTSKKAQVQEVAQNYSSFLHSSRFVGEKWMDIRVFVDSSLLLTDSDACARAGKYVRVGQPEGDEGRPTCSNLISSDCWKLCEEKDVLTTRKASYITEICGLVVGWLQSTMKVKRVIGNIRIPKQAVPSGCADHLSFPDYYSKSGIPEADLVLVVTGRPTFAHTVAWATECAADQTGRPVFGHINIGPGELENYKDQKDYIYKILLHEVTHVLGFNSYKFPFYTDRNGKPYPSVTKTHIIGDKQITKIVTPGVVAAARDHFGCNELDGVPLEDGGDETTTDSHWEKRIFRNEYMTGSSDRTAVISKISLALLEVALDTGWYRVDYDQAEYFEWGSGMGCSFVNEACSGWDSRKGYFCGVPGAQGCTTDRTAMGYCNLIRHKSQLPESSRYFSDPNFGGSDELSDYCPYVAAYANGICVDSSNQPDSPVFGEHFGENSKCFETTMVKNGWTKRDIHPMCYDYRCAGSSDEPKLEVQVGSIWYGCPFSGNLEGVPGFSGFLVCPNASFCTTHNSHNKRAMWNNSGHTTSPILFLALISVVVLLL